MMFARNQFFPVLKNKLKLSKEFSSSIFIISLEYKVTLGEVDKHIDSHKKFLEECYKNKVFIASGRKVPRTGGVIIASSKDRESLEEIILKDPFHEKGIADYQITEFQPTMFSDEFQNMIVNDSKSNVPEKK